MQSNNHAFSVLVLYMYSGEMWCFLFYSECISNLVRVCMRVSLTSSHAYLGEQALHLK
jgi:hypothetical protein